MVVSCLFVAGTRRRWASWDGCSAATWRLSTPRCPFGATSSKRRGFLHHRRRHVHHLCAATREKSQGHGEAGPRLHVLGRVFFMVVLRLISFCQIKKKLHLSCCEHFAFKYIFCGSNWEWLELKSKWNLLVPSTFASTHFVFGFSFNFGT